MPEDGKATIGNPDSVVGHIYQHSLKSSAHEALGSNSQAHFESLIEEVRQGNSGGIKT